MCIPKNGAYQGAQAYPLMLRFGDCSYPGFTERKKTLRSGASASAG